MCYRTTMPERPSLLSAPVPALVRSIAVPASVGYLFNTLYNVVDTWYAGRLSTDALAALGLSFPVFFAVIAVASGLATGVSALVANTIGSGRPDEARTLGAQALTFTALASLVLSIAGFVLVDRVFTWMGAAPGPAALAADYMRIVFAGSIFFNLTHVLNALLVARGDTHTYRTVLVLGLLLNVVLDPWFIYGGFGLPALGFDGIAWSTALIQVISAAYLYRVVRRRDALPRLTRVALALPARTAADLLRQSGPAMLNMATIGLGILVITYFVNRHGSAAVAAYGIATRIEQIILLPAIGLNMAVLAIAGQNNGAGRPDRVRETVRAALRFGLLTLIPALALMLVWPRQAMALFTRDAVVIAVGADYLRVASVLVYAYVLLFTLTAALQAVKQPLYAIWIGLYRQLLAPLAIILALDHWTTLGLWGIWISIAFTTGSAALFTLWYTRRTLPRPPTTPPA